MAENDTWIKWASLAMARSKPQKYGLAQLAISWLNICHIAQLAQAKAQPCHP